MFPPRPAEFPRLLGSFLLHLPGWWSDPGSGFSASREEDGTLLAAPIFIPMGCHQQHWGLMQETLANTGIYAIAIGTKLDLCNINGDLTNKHGYLSNEHGDTSNKNVRTPVTRAMPMEKDLDHAHDCKLDDTLTTWTSEFRMRGSWNLQ